MSPHLFSRRAVLLGALGGALTVVPAPHADPVVTGRVTSAADGTPIPSAQLVADRFGASAVTDADGRYRLPLPAAARGSVVRLTARALAYGAATRPYTVTRDSAAIDFALAPSAIVLEHVVATGTTANDSRGDRGRKAAEQGGAALPQPAASPLGASVRPAPPYRQQVEPSNTEQYDHIAEAGFLSPRAHPLSTFSIDVDRASYANVRRFVRNGQLPPADAIRLEELVNYFPYDYGHPRRGMPFAIRTDVAETPWAAGHHLVRIALQAPTVETRDLPPANLVFLLDVSGSMQDHNKLPLVKESLRLLVERLRPQDQVAIAVYAGAAGLVLPPTRGDQTTRILDALDRLAAGGSTNGAEGIRLAYRTARDHFLPRGNNRVILCTDGDFNVGVSSDGDLVRLIEEERKSGVFLTVLGFGMGNYKDSRMEKLAQHGNGNYGYIDDLPEARKTFVHEMGGTLLAVAKDVKLQVEFDPTHVAGYRLLGYENRRVRDEDFDDDTKDAGELGAGHTVTALYEVIPVGHRDASLVKRPRELRFQQRARERTGGAGIAVVQVRWKPADGETSRLHEVAVPARPGEMDREFRFASAVAEFALVARKSEFRAQASADDAIVRARGALGDDPQGWRAEFVELASRWRELARRERVLTDAR
jgi:Ca-activated chloride channel family protein